MDEEKCFTLEQLDEIILAQIQEYCDRIKETWLDPEGPGV